MLTITVLVENSDGEGLCGEHGLSLYIEYEGRRYLLDTGATGLFTENAAKLGLSLAEVEAVFLSHAHYDHAGGLPRFFAENAHAKVYLQEAAAENCYSEKAGAREYIGIPRGVLREHENTSGSQEGFCGSTQIDSVSCREHRVALGSAWLMQSRRPAYGSCRTPRRIWKSRAGKPICTGWKMDVLK